MRIQQYGCQAARRRLANSVKIAPNGARSTGRVANGPVLSAIEGKVGRYEGANTSRRTKAVPCGVNLERRVRGINPLRRLKEFVYAFRLTIFFKWDFQWSRDVLSSSK